MADCYSSSWPSQHPPAEGHSTQFVRNRYQGYLLDEGAVVGLWGGEYGGISLWSLLLLTTFLTAVSAVVDDPHWADLWTLSLAAATATGALLLAIFSWLRWMAKQGRKRHTFGLLFPSVAHPPVLESTSRTKKKTIFLQERSQRILIEIPVRVTLDMRRRDIRFVKGPEGGNLEEPIPLKIAAVYRAAGDGSEVGSFGQPWEWNNAPGKTGINIYCDPPWPLRSDESLYLYLFVETVAAWKGYLSVRGYDEDGDRQFAPRRAFEIIQPTPGMEGPPTL